MKVLRKEFIVENNQVEHIMSERKILEAVRSPFIVDMHFAFQTEDKLYFIIDYVPGGELFTYLRIQRRVGSCFNES